MEYETEHGSAKSLECPVCMNIFKEPMILSCSHTFCKSCLERLLECQAKDNILKCPVCRVEKELPKGDVSKLPSNLALQSLLEEAVKKRQPRKGNGPAQSRRKCGQHPEEEDQCFCSDCRRYVCIRCGVTEHVYKGHRIVDASEQESNQRKAVEELKSKAHERQYSLQDYIDIVSEQEVEIGKEKKQRIDDINQAYDESVQQLAERKKILVQDVTGQFDDLEKELHSLKEEARQQTNQVTTMTDLVANENQVLLETEALDAHITLREDLEKVLRKQNLDNDDPVKLGRKGEQIVFRKTKDFDLGSISMISEKNPKINIASGFQTMADPSPSRATTPCLNFGSSGVKSQNCFTFGSYTPFNNSSFNPLYNSPHQGMKFAFSVKR